MKTAAGFTVDCIRASGHNDRRACCFLRSETLSPVHCPFPDWSPGATQRRRAQLEAKLQQLTLNLAEEAGPRRSKRSRGEIIDKARTKSPSTEP